MKTLIISLISKYYFARGWQNISLKIKIKENLILTYPCAKIISAVGLVFQFILLFLLFFLFCFLLLLFILNKTLIFAIICVVYAGFYAYNLPAFFTVKFSIITVVFAVKLQYNSAFFAIKFQK